MVALSAFPEIDVQYPALLPLEKDGTTALMAASVRGHKAAVDVLLRHGANVDQQNLDGHTALMFAYNGRNQVHLCALENERVFFPSFSNVCSLDSRTFSFCPLMSMALIGV